MTSAVAVAASVTALMLPTARMLSRILLQSRTFASTNHRWPSSKRVRARRRRRRRQLSYHPGGHHDGLEPETHPPPPYVLPHAVHVASLIRARLPQVPPCILASRQCKTAYYGRRLGASLSRATCRKALGACYSTHRCSPSLQRKAASCSTAGRFCSQPCVTSSRVLLPLNRFSTIVASPISPMAWSHLRVHSLGVQMTRLRLALGRRQPPPALSSIRAPPFTCIQPYVTSLRPDHVPTIS